MIEFIRQFGELRNTHAGSEEVQSLVEKWQNSITDNFYNCTKEILSCLGQMYIGDEKFTENIDKNGEGTAKFMSKAIEIYCLK
ncbi:MAG: TipAS antibiotic-recognition domain-containing protein [Terrisporobacter sp.]